MEFDKSVAKRIPDFSQRKSDCWSEVEGAQDVLADILSRIPVKCLLRFKVVSKLWNRLIRSPSFTRLHLSRSRENEIYILYPYMDDVLALHLIDDDGVTTEVITIPGVEDMAYVSVICSYNGLICFTNFPWFHHFHIIQQPEENLKIRNFNPATRESWLLPRGSPSEQELGVGVAYGPETSEYRVYRFFSSKFDQAVHPRCEVFSSITRTWRGIGFVEHHPMGGHHAFLNGKVYWFIAGEVEGSLCIPRSILSVDMEDNFKVIKLPNNFVTAHSFLIDLEGCLSLVLVYDEDCIVQIWILKDENNSDWEMKCSADLQHDTAECVNSVAVRKKEIFFITTEHYFVFNIDEITKEWEQFIFTSGLDRILLLVSHTQKAFSPVADFCILQERTKISEKRDYGSCGLLPV